MNLAKLPMTKSRDAHSPNGSADAFRDAKLMEEFVIGFWVIRSLNQLHQTSDNSLSDS